MSLFWAQPGVNEPTFLLHKSHILVDIASVHSGGILISKSYLLAYPDGSKKSIGRAERDDLLLSGLAREVSPRKYAFTGEARTLHSFSELGSLAQSFTTHSLRRFLPGSFIVEHEGGRRKELLETPGALAYRLKLYPGQARA